jgi:hypothetical protein
MNHLLDDMKEAEQKLSNSRTCAVTNSDQTSAFRMKQTLFCIAREELELAKMDLRRFYATLKIDLWKTKKSTWDGVKGELEMLPTLSLELARPLSRSSSCSMKMKMNLCVRLSMTFFMRQDRQLSQT